MNSKKTVSGSTTTDKRVFMVSLVIFLGTIILVFAFSNRATLFPASTNNAAQPGQRMTLEPQVLANLTAFPAAPALTGDLADQVHQIQTMLDDCPDYVEARRGQMQQHITWLLNPSQIPTDILIALGPKPNARLIFGMATYTSIEWGTRNRAAGSCLVPMGQALNKMLVAQGEDPLPEFAS